MTKKSSSPQRRPPSARVAWGWQCPKCRRSFSQVNQRHACGTGNQSDVVRNRPPTIVRLFRVIEAFAQSLGPIEIVARERYVLLRSLRIFADLVIMTDAVRIAIHLRRRVEHPLFFKVVSDAKKVTHVAKLRIESDFQELEPYLKEAYDDSLEPRV
jgi:hypothetical protein